MPDVGGARERETASVCVAIYIVFLQYFCNTFPWFSLFPSILVFVLLLLLLLKLLNQRTRKFLVRFSCCWLCIWNRIWGIFSSFFASFSFSQNLVLHCSSTKHTVRHPFSLSEAWFEITAEGGCEKGNTSSLLDTTVVWVLYQPLVSVLPCDAVWVETLYPCFLDIYFVVLLVSFSCRSLFLVVYSVLLQFLPVQLLWLQLSLMLVSFCLTTQEEKRHRKRKGLFFYGVTHSRLSLLST